MILQLLSGRMSQERKESHEGVHLRGRYRIFEKLLSDEESVVSIFWGGGSLCGTKLRALNQRSDDEMIYAELSFTGISEKKQDQKEPRRIKGKESDV